MLYARTAQLKVTLTVGTPIPLAPSSAERGQSRRLARTPGRRTAGDSVEAVDQYDDKFSAGALSKPTFDYQTALSLALASRLAYVTKPAVIRETAEQRWKLKNCAF